MKTCPKCCAEHSKPGTFCSRTCANSRTWSDEVNKKRSITSKKYYETVPKETLTNISLHGWFTRGGKKYVGEYTPISFRKCSHCNVSFVSPYNRTWCKDSCYLEIKRKNWRGNKQRFRKENFDSSWEVDLVMWFEENTIEYKTKTDALEWVDSKGKKRKYFPDFYLPQLGVYVDPKNPIVAEMQKEKIDYISKAVKLICGSPLHIKEVIKDMMGVRFSPEVPYITEEPV